MRTRTCVYDIETMVSYFSAAFVDINTDEKFIFEVYKVKGRSINQIKRLLNFLDTCKGLIGYNNLFFDYPVLHELLVNREFIERLKIRQLIEFIYQKAQTIITKQNKTKRKISKDKMIIPQLDLMYMNYFNSKSRFVSLKQMEFVMRYHNVQDMPYDHRFKIKTVQQANEIASYNFNDVDATHQFYKMCMDAIVLRRELTRKYKMDLMTEPNTNLAKEIFAMYLLEDMKISRTELNSMGTLRDVIDVEKEVILPIIKFEDDRLNKVVEFFKLQKVTYLKGFFTDIDKKNPGYNILREISNPEMIDTSNGVIESFNVLFKNHTYVFGSGGIHSKIEGKSFVCKDHQIIVDADVSSYYPNQSIKFGFKPKHLGDTFLRVYEYLYNLRGQYGKGTTENEILKLCLNSSYGQSGSEYSYLYDLLMMLSICINGQLLLMMLNEQIVKIGGVITSSNTDGSSVLIDKDKLPELKKIFEWWQNLTQLKLEYAYYSEQHYQNVNSYLWVPHPQSYNFDKLQFEINKKTEIKLKGFFVTNPEWHKDHSMLIVQKALVGYYHNKIPVEKTITECKNIFDFCKMVKEKGCKFKAEWFDKDLKKYSIKQGKIVRYYVCKSKGRYNNIKLYKYMPPLVKKTYTEKYKERIPNQMDIFDIKEVSDCIVRRERISNVEANSYVEIYNRHIEMPFEEYNIDYDYYINECYKVINTIK